MKDNQISLVDEQGKEVTFEIVFTYDSEEYNKTYIVYKALDNEEEVYAGILNVEGENQVIDEILDDEEFNMIQEVIDSFYEEN